MGTTVAITIAILAAAMGLAILVGTFLSGTNVDEKEE